MAQVSKYMMSEKIKREINEIFLETFALLYKKEDIINFLEDFFSPTERIVLSKRITIALMLKKGYSYEMIKKLIKVSQPTVADVNLKLKYAGKGYHKILDQMLVNRKIKSVFDNIEKFILAGLTIGHGKGTGYWFQQKIKKQRETSSII